MAGGWWRGEGGALGWKRGLTKGHERSFVGDDMFAVLTMVMVSWVFTYVKAHQIIHAEYVRFIVCQLYHNKSVKNKAKRQNVGL